MITLKLNDKGMQILLTAVIKYYNDANWTAQHGETSLQRELAQTHANFCMEVWTTIATHMAEKQEKAATQ